VLSLTTSAQPSSPAEGDTYIVPDSASGTDWSGQDGKLAHYYNGSWKFYDVFEGLSFWVNDEDLMYAFDGSDWVEVGGGGGSAGGSAAEIDAMIANGVDPAVARAVVYNDIGAPVAGGYFGGVIDTIAGTIDSQDDYQTGQRYALIVSPKELEGGRGSSPAANLPTGDREWDTQDRSSEVGCRTRWNGLDSTEVILAKNDSSYEAIEFIRECRNLYPAPATGGGSEWYLPALDELALLYTNFKPNYTDNTVSSSTENFPGLQDSGFNPSSDPTSPAYSNSPREPEKTPILGFRQTEAAALDLDKYWTSTDADSDRAWAQSFGQPGFAGIQFGSSKNFGDSSVRPVRRVNL
jgi:hypothetical protein